MNLEQRVNCVSKVSSSPLPRTSGWKTGIVFPFVILLGTSASRMPQPKPNQEEWGEKFNTEGAKLVLRETERSRLYGRTVVSYSLFVSGLPHNAHYTLWSRLAGRDPQPAADALLNNEGRLVSQLADAKRHVAEDPINLKVFAGKGEPKEFGLISSDGKFRASPHASTAGPQSRITSAARGRGRSTFFGTIWSTHAC